MVKMHGIKHLIECHCILPQYRFRKDPIFHRFIVFSIIDDGDTVVPKFAQCNNCGAVHNVIDICKSEIFPGKDEIKSLRTIDDIKLSLPNDIVDLLNSYSCPLPTWEQTEFIFQEQDWGAEIVLIREELDEIVTGKLLKIENGTAFKVESFMIGNQP